MSRLSIGLGALLLAAVGFAGGAMGSAWHARDVRARPWRALRLEHEGTDGTSTRTRVVFENPKLPLAGIELARSPDGAPELGRLEVRGGEELTVRYGDNARPSSLESPDGARALLDFTGEKVRVTFFAPDGSEAAAKTVRVPVELSGALRLARAEAWSLVGEAWAAEEEDDQIIVRREIELRLEARAAGGKDITPGNAQVEASCAPFTCLPVTPDAPTPGQSTVRIAVTGTTKRSTLKAPAGSALAAFEAEASDERSTAKQVVPGLGAVVAAAGVTALACKSAGLTWAICVPGLSKSVAGAAIAGLSSYDVETKGRELGPRALELYYQDQARASLDRETRVQVCLSRDGYARSCIDVAGRPFAAGRAPAAQAAIELRRGIGGALAGSFDLVQSDGADCKFSPSPRTTGPLRLSFDNERGTVTATFKADERGTRPGLRCSLGTATMRWTQRYDVSATQTFAKEQLLSGGKLPLRLSGTMSGVGGYQFTSCASSGGVSANCPAGRSEAYSYPIELSGELDLDTQTGSGRITVKNAPLATNGTWRIPAGGTR